MTGTWPPLGQHLNDLNGDWNAYCDACYAIYHRDFHQTKPSWPISGQRFAIKRQPEYEGKCNTFWHIISEGSDETNRTPDLSRCERIGWPRLILNEFHSVHPGYKSERVVWWKNKRQSGRILIALPDFSYLVVVAERAGYVLLWTAYPVEYESQRGKLRAEYDYYWGHS